MWSTQPTPGHAGPDAPATSHDPRIWLVRSSDRTQVYEVTAVGPAPRQLTCSCPAGARSTALDRWAVCKHMAAVATIRAETDRMAALIPVCRDQLAQGIAGSPEQNELTHLYAHAANREDWEDAERAAIAQLLTYQDRIDPETWQQRPWSRVGTGFGPPSHHPAIDAATHALLDPWSRVGTGNSNLGHPLLGAQPIDLSDEEIAILSAQQEEVQPTASDELDYALLEQLEDSMGEPDALYDDYARSW